MRSTEHRAPAAVLRALALVLALAAVAPSASGGEPGAISGTVTDEGGNAIPAACVDVFFADGGVAASVLTAADGTYRAGDLPEGGYKISIDPCGSGSYYAEWFDDVATFDDAHVVAVAAGAETTGIDAELATSFIPPGGPQNDEFSASAEVAATPFVRGSQTNGATVEDGEPRPCGSIGATVWFRYTPADTRPTVVTTMTSEFDTVVAVYTGSDLASLTEVGCSNDIAAPHDRGGIVSFVADAGTTYFIQAGGFEGAAGFLRLAVV